jgi:glycosyltransferase involved in cell wall biosynthesis
VADASARPLDVSVVVPVYGNGDTVTELRARLHGVMLAERLTYELIFVNDACPFDSLATLERLATEHSEIRVVALPCNVGQHGAVLRGLARAHGRCAVVMDGDLQDPPEALPSLLAELRKGYGAVFAGRRGSYESRGRLITSRAFKTLLHVLCGVPRDAGMYVVMSRAMVERVLAREDRRPFVVAAIGAAGLPLSSIPVERAARATGRSAYSSWMRLRAASSAIVIALGASLGRTIRANHSGS